MTKQSMFILNPEPVLHEHDPVLDDENVQQVDQVGQVVGDEPGGDVVLVLIVPEELSEGNGPGVVNETESDECQPAWTCIHSILVRSERTISTNIEAAPGVNITRYSQLGPPVHPPRLNVCQGLFGGVSGLREVLQDEMSAGLLPILLDLGCGCTISTLYY